MNLLLPPPHDVRNKGEAAPPQVQSDVTTGKTDHIEKVRGLELLLESEIAALRRLSEASSRLWRVHDLKQGLEVGQ